MASEPKRRKGVSRFPNEHYTVAWICALERELTTARLAFDEIHGIPQSVHRSDTNNYTLGTVAGHNVVAACLAAGTMGNNPAAVLVSNIQASFPSLRFGILAGIGGGIPSSANDIRLGDVVVSQPTPDHGGVIQVDNGKVHPDGVFQRTGTLDRPPPILLNAVNSIKSRKDIEGSQIPTIYAEMFRKLNPDAREKYARPRDDHLYKADYTHPKNEPTCDNCDSYSLVRRRHRSNVQVHYGVIASGNAVIKDAKHRDGFYKAYGALCVEMEAAGLMNSFPCLVVRGICDYADSHKNKAWQFYAAMVASAYSKELLGVITPAEVPKVTLSKEKTMDEVEEVLREKFKKYSDSGVDISIRNGQINASTPSLASPGRNSQSDEHSDPPSPGGRQDADYSPPEVNPMRPSHEDVKSFRRPPARHQEYNNQYDNWPSANEPYEKDPYYGNEPFVHKPDLDRDSDSDYSSPRSPPLDLYQPPPSPPSQFRRWPFQRGPLSRFRRSKSPLSPSFRYPLSSGPFPRFAPGTIYPPPHGDPTRVHAWITIKNYQGRLLLSKFKPRGRPAIVYELTRRKLFVPLFRKTRVKTQIEYLNTSPYEPSSRPNPMTIYDVLRGNSSAMVSITDKYRRTRDATIVMLTPELLRGGTATPYQGVWSAYLPEPSTYRSSGGLKHQFFLFHQPTSNLLNIYSITGGASNPACRLFATARVRGSVYTWDKTVMINIWDPASWTWHTSHMEFRRGSRSAVRIDGVAFDRVDVLKHLR